MSNNVDYQHAEYRAMLPSWQKMHDACISETHVHSLGEEYLPRLDEMDDAQYKAYTKRAEFPMFARHALETFQGMTMRKPIIIEGLDRNHEFLQNIDSKGSTIDVYVSNLVETFLRYRRAGTLVEYPPSDPNQSKADAEKNNVRPRLAFYDHSSIINWKTETKNNLTVLSLVVLKEAEDVSNDEFTHEYKNRYRVLKLENGAYLQEVYNHNKELVEIKTPLKNNKPLNYIPFEIHGGIKVKSPAALPLVEQNFHWYMKDADYQHGLHYTALPTPWVVGVDPKDPNAPKTIGPQKLWMLPIGATCGMLEFTGKGLGQVAASMQDTFANIVLLASQILVPKSAYDESATSSSIRSVSETASLSAMVKGLSEEMTRVINWACEWAGYTEDKVLLEINSDFMPMTLSGADVSAYVSAVIKEGFSKRTLFELLKKGEIIDGDRQLEDELADIEKEAKDRMDKEVELADRLAESSAKYTTKFTENPDSKQNEGQDAATPAQVEGRR
jgi:hypothetical protein